METLAQAALASAESIAENLLASHRRLDAGLYPHQREGIAFLLKKRRAILGDDMGLGKTRQAIVALEATGPDGVFLVVCPASLKLNWRREILAVVPDAAVEVLGSRLPSPDKPRWVVANYDLLRKQADRLRNVAWTGVILDEAHFIKNASQRTSECLKLLGADARQVAGGPAFAFLLTGTPVTNRPRDLFNLLRAVGHPAATSFLSFAKRYCGAYRNDYGWVTDGASNLESLADLLREVMLRRKKDEVLDLPGKIRTWVPVECDSAAAERAQADFAAWFWAGDAARPNDTAFLGRLQKVRVAIHKAKHAAVVERVRDVLATGKKVIVFACFNDGVRRLAKTLGEACVTITGDDVVERRQEAVDRFQDDESVRVIACNLAAGGVGLTLTAGTHVLFQDLDWVPANHLQAEDRAYRMGQRERVTVEYLLLDRTLDGYIAKMLEAKLALVQAIEGDGPLPQGALVDLHAELVRQGPALLHEVRLAQQDDAGARIESLPAVSKAVEEAIGQDGYFEYPSSRNPSVVYRVTYGRGGHLECTCDGFRWRGECSHVRDARRRSA